MEHETHIDSWERQTSNRFLNMIHIRFTDRKKRVRDYYYATRNPDEKLKIRTHTLDPEGICIYAVTREKHPRIVMIHEYRFPVDEYLYTLPAGLIDPGETPGQAAVREMKEETGFAFTEYTGGEGSLRRPFFLAPGFSDEPGSAVFGTVEVPGGRPENESSEWIEVHLADKKEALRILREEKLSVRAAFLLAAFVSMPPENPFGFLDLSDGEEENI